MNRKLLLCILFLLFPLLSRGQSLEDVLNQLDKAIANRPAYIAAKQKSLEEMRRQAIRATGEKQFEAYSELFKEYRCFSADSAIHYANVCKQWAIDHQDPVREQNAQIMEVVGLSIIGQYDQANTLLESFDRQIYPANKEDYFSARTDISYWEGSFSALPDIKSKYQKLSQDYRDSLRRITQDKTHKEQSDAILMSGTNEKKSASLTRKYLYGLPEGHDSIRYFANHLGTLYEHMGMRDSSEYFFALSAISDMERGVREHSSLINLSIELFQGGDIERAYAYMNQCLKDAEECKSALRTLEMSKMMPQIVNTYDNELRKNQVILLVISIILLCLLIFTASACRHIYKITQTLREAKREIQLDNEKLKNLNEQLEEHLAQEQELSQKLIESNRIKDTYLVNYMRECSSCIDKMESYRKSLQQLAMRNNTSKLFDAIRSTELIDQEVDNFYKGFDETFLSIFPTFVEDLNKLLTSEGQLVPSGHKRLSTELRIAALIRLGITDSNEIANFLRYSVKTIYNYRTKIRNNALGDRNELGNEVRKIGVVKAS